MQRRANVFFTLLVSFISMPLAFGVFGRPLAEWRFPLNYDNDGLNVLAIAQMGMERAWASGSDRLGAPGVLDLAFYPMPESAQLLILKLIGWVAPNAAITVNIYFFVTFFLCTCTALVALRQLDVGPPAAALGALIFSLLPYHFSRGEEHIFVNGYFWVPFLAWGLLTLHSQEPKSRWRDATRVGVAFCAPFINVYYSFFFGIIGALLTAIEAGRRRSVIPALRFTGVSLALGSGFLLNNVRSLPLYYAGTLAFERSPRDSELYGLKLAQMILPAFETISGVFARASEHYRLTTFATESVSNDLGLLAGCAFIATLACLFLLPRVGLVARACECTLLCVLYGTMGGLSTVFAFVVSPFLRSPNRIVVFIVFFALVVAMHLLQTFLTRWKVADSRPLNVALYGALTCLLLWDLSHKDLRRGMLRQEKLYQEDAAYFSRLESTLPEGARLFQVPHLSYPEHGPGGAEYDTFRCYLHTKKIIGSYGTVARAAQDDGNKRAASDLAAGNIDAFKAYLRAHNFSGVLLNRKVEGLQFLKLEALLRAAFVQEPGADAGDFVYFEMAR